MFPPRRVSLTLSLWLLGTAVCLAQTPEDEARSPWVSLVGGMPMWWSGIFVCVIVAVALLVQTVFLLRQRGVSPSGFVAAFSNAIRSGNYQGAWATCNRWRQGILPRILRPALERIGQGRKPVEACLVERVRIERRNLDLMLWGMAASAAGAGIFCLLAATGAWHRVGASVFSVEAPRARALAAGDIALFAALAMAIVVPVFLSSALLRARAKRLLTLAKEQGALLIVDLPYEEIEGLRIGADFDAGSLLGDTSSGPGKRLQVSRELTTLCPSCNGPINPTRDNCPHCGQPFAWS